MRYGATQETKRPVTVDLVSRVETTVDHPVEKVWPYILHWNSFVDEKEFLPHRVAGANDSVGEIKGVSHFDKTGRMESFFFLKTILIVPNKQLVLKVLSPEYAYDGETGLSTEVPQTGYEVFSTRENDGRTAVSLDVFVEMMPPGVTEDQAQSIAEQYRIETEEKWYQKYFPKLKQLLAQS